MKADLKRILWKARRNILEGFWKVTGGQKRRSFSDSYVFTPQTIFPSHRRMCLPKGDARSQLVRFTDFVQLHAACRLLERNANKPIVIDVGAFQGAYAVILGKICQRNGGRLIALEPDSKNYSELVQNVKLNYLNDTVACEQLAVSDHPGNVEIDHHFSQSHIRVSNDISTEAGVECETLESVIDRHKIDRVDLLIIDVEGAELPVLKGIPWGSLEIRRIFCELHPYNWKYFGYDRETLQTFLNKHNFRCFDMYFVEHKEFIESRYIGPTLLLKTGQDHV